MDNILQHISPLPVEMVNNMQIYLNINMLSKISNSNGAQLVTYLLKPPATLSTSTLAIMATPTLPTTESIVSVEKA